MEAFFFAERPHEVLAELCRVLRPGGTVYADAAPADPRVLNDGADGDRTLDDLF